MSSVLKNLQNGSGSHPASCSLDTWGSSLHGDTENTSPFCALFGVDADIPYVLSPVCLGSGNKRGLPFVFRLRVGRCVYIPCEYFYSRKFVVL
jgi:hypothetical protein